MIFKQIIIFCLIFKSVVGMKIRESEVDNFFVELSNIIVTPEVDNFDCKCGIPRNVETFEDGNKNSQGSTIYPWVVSLQIVNSEDRCAGAIIASRYIITAAHCASNGRVFERKDIALYDLKDIKVTVGDDKYPKAWKKKSVSVSKIMVPEKYFWIHGDTLLGDGDIALLELSERLDLNMYTPACISQTADDAMFLGLKNRTEMLSAEVFVVRFNEPERTKREIQTKKTNITQFSTCFQEVKELNYTANVTHYPICGQSFGSTNVLQKVNLPFDYHLI